MIGIGSGRSPKGLIRAFSSALMNSGVGAGFGTRNARCVLSSGSEARRSRVGRYLKYSRAFSGVVATTPRVSTPICFSRLSIGPICAIARRQNGHQSPIISARNSGLWPR
jgi:hypothetical protein